MIHMLNAGETLHDKIIDYNSYYNKIMYLLIVIIIYNC